MEKTYHIDFNDEKKAASDLIQMFIEQLTAYRGTTPHPEELEWEIRVYKYMLEDPKERLAAYQKLRSSDRGTMAPRSKRTVVSVLGWEIP